ncbi:MAG TPA: hypothetical protein VHB73_06280 [Alphaproteobacteria bacterium]|nr:hypothetical protein [Alphaproteobacteria bacterium]
MFEGVAKKPGEEKTFSPIVGSVWKEKGADNYLFVEFLGEARGANLEKPWEGMARADDMRRKAKATGDYSGIPDYEPFVAQRKAEALAKVAKAANPARIASLNAKP